MKILTFVTYFQLDLELIKYNYQRKICKITCKTHSGVLINDTVKKFNY